MRECPGILLVEDDEDDYILARDLLRDIYEGPLRLDWAQTWSDGLEGIVQDAHDIYLIDYRLGDRNGVELVRQVVDQGCTAPIILLTGQDDRDIDLEAMRAGATDYLVKGELSAALLDRAIRYAIRRNESEAALRESEARAASAEQRLVDAIDSLSEGLVLWDADHRLVLANSTLHKLYAGFAELLTPGTPIEEFLRGAVERGQFPEAVGREEEWVAERLRERSGIAPPIQRRLKDGRWLLISDQSTAEGGTVSVLTDITGIKEREAELLAAKRDAELADRAKSEFLAGMSHELRTPLNSIIGFSELIQKGLYGPVGHPNYIEYAEDINNSGQHLLELINDILDISKIEAGKEELHERVIDIGRAINSCATMINTRVDESELRLELSLADPIPHLWADERKLKQIVLNLLSNAVKFTPSGGWVSVEVREAPDSGLAIEVSDSGIGIAPEDIPKAMSAFGQVDSKLNRKYEGTGLGLPLTLALVELHGGTLDLTSAVGRGTTVTVHFPPHRNRDANGAEIPGNEAVRAVV